MADIPATNWNETDASNTDAAPDGAPEGMAPSGVNNVLRAHQGAVKRFWDKINATATTGGTTSAYTLSYSVTPGAYYDGEIISFVVNATNAAAATINVNALGAKALRLFGGNLLPGALLANDIVQARYGSAAGAFDITPQNGWVRIGEQDPSAASTVDFTSIPAGVKHLMLVGESLVGTNAATINLRTYGADGVIDTGASDYQYWAFTTNSANATSASAATTTSFNLVPAVSSSATAGATFRASLNNIQASTYTKIENTATWLANDGSTGASLFGGGWRAEADRITGLRVLTSTGTLTGKITLFGSA